MWQKKNCWFNFLYLVHQNVLKTQWKQIRSITNRVKSLKTRSLAPDSEPQCEGWCCHLAAKWHINNERGSGIQMCLFSSQKRWSRLLYKIISQTWCLVFLMNNYLWCEDRGISGIDEWSLIILGLQNNDFSKMTTPLQKSSSSLMAAITAQ